VEGQKMKKRLIALVLVLVLAHSMIAMAEGVKPESNVKSTYFKAGVLWDINGRTIDMPSDKNIKDLHVDGKFPYLYGILNLENINFKKNFSLGFLNLTLVFLSSQEPLQ
jgi:hypothetical protein